MWLRFASWTDMYPLNYGSGNFDTRGPIVVFLGTTLKLPWKPLQKTLSAVLCGAFLFASAAAQTDNYELVHAFRSAGQPAGSLIQASEGFFYGTTDFGGANGVGTVYRMDSAGNTVSLHSFGYTDGAVPAAALIQASDGLFYGTTSQGGASNVGSIFRMDIAGNVTRLHSFNTTDGATPLAALLQAADGYFYGTTSGGGASAQGTVFRMDSAGNVTMLHSFAGSEGEYPHATLVQATDGGLYGTTSGITGTYFPTVFRIDSTGNLTVLHVFAGQDDPSALIQAADGNFYGTTEFGGNSGEGAVFRMEMSGNVTTLHDATNPRAPLVQASDGYLYGADAAYIFKVDYSGNLTTLYPLFGQLQIHAAFYGTTRGGARRLLHRPASLLSGPLQLPRRDGRFPRQDLRTAVRKVLNFKPWPRRGGDLRKRRTT